MNHRPRWGPPSPVRPGMRNPNFPAQRFPPPGHQSGFPGPPRGPPGAHAGFNPRGQRPQMFNRPPQQNMGHFRPRQMRPTGPMRGNCDRFPNPPFNSPNGPNHNPPFNSPNPKPPFNSPHGPNFRPRAPFNNSHPQNRPPFTNSHPQNRPNYQQTNGGPQGSSKQKAKVDKRDLAENNKFFCDSCDKGFKLEDKYKEHVNEHQKCKFEGCTYVAAPKLVQLHIKLQHNSGIARKIWSLESPEDIKKWRDERRKNFPTLENIEKKKAAMADKIARGEVIEEKYFGKMKQRGNSRFERGRGRGRGQSRGEGQERSKVTENGGQNKRPMDNGNGTDQNAESPAKKLRTEGKEGTSTKNGDLSLDAEKDPLAFFYNAIGSDFDSDSESDTEFSAKTKPVEEQSGKVTAAGALGSLITSYGDSSGASDDGEGKKDNDTSKTKVKEEEGESKQKDWKNRRKNRNRGRKNRGDKNKGQQAQKIDNKSLLEKLLAKEIRKERNQILQCVYHIVQHKYFEDPADGAMTNTGSDDESPECDKNMNNKMDDKISQAKKTVIEEMS